MSHYLRLAFLATIVLFVGLAGCEGLREKDPGPEPKEPSPEPTEPGPEPLNTSKPIKCEGHTEIVTSVAVSPDGKLVVSGSDDQTLRFWNAADGKLIRTVKAIDPLPMSGWVGAVAFSPDGKTLVAYHSVKGQQRLLIYDAATGKPAPERLPLREGGYGVAFSPDGKALASASRKGVRVWSVAMGDHLHAFTFDRSISRALRVRFSPDGKYLAATFMSFGANEEEGPVVRVWNLATGKEVFAARYRVAVAVAFSPNGKLLAFDGDKEIVEVYDWARKKRVARFQTDSSTGFCLAFAPDGESIYTGGNPEVKRWEAATCKLAGSLEGHTDQVHDIALSKDGKVMATAGRDKQVLIWHLGAKVEEVTLMRGVAEAAR